MGEDDRRSMTEAERVELASTLRPTLRARRFVDELAAGQELPAAVVLDATGIVVLVAQALAGEVAAQASVAKLARAHYGGDGWADVRRFAGMVTLHPETGRCLVPAEVLLVEAAETWPADRDRWGALDVGRAEKILSRIGRPRKTNGLTVAGAVARLLLESGALGFESKHAALAKLRADEAASPKVLRGQADAFEVDFAREVSRNLERPRGRR